MHDFRSKRGMLIWALLIATSACAAVVTPTIAGAQAAKRAAAYAVDAGGRSIPALEVGSTLHVGAHRLQPGTMYEFRLGFDGSVSKTRARAVSFARVGTNRDGAIPPFVLWYESGVTGCSDRQKPGDRPAPHTYLTFDEAERALAGKTLTISVHAVDADKTGRVHPSKLRVSGTPTTVMRLPVVRRRSPVVYASDAAGCMLNSQLAGAKDVYVSGRHFTPGEQLEIAMVPNQRLWHVGDSINDVTGADFAAAAERVTVGRDGRFTVRAWARPSQRRGAYDIVAHRPGTPPHAVRRVGPRDIISFAAETGFVLYLIYPVGGPTMDIAGRPLWRRPYFQFADSFADTNDPVWGAVDPTYVPAGHPGGTYAAYYVVAHRGVTGWNPATGGATDLVDVSGGIEIHPVKAGCINGTNIIVWHPPLVPGPYDVVVDFGVNPAATPEQYQTDQNYDATVDFLDGANQVGFVVTKDPYELGPFPIGTDRYTQDDYFPTLGTASNVDLRAVVRYPATAAGAGQPVAAGQHPLFLIQHGNHNHCRVLTDGQLFWPAYERVRQGTFSWNDFYNSQYGYADCPDRVKNHEGYLRLLDILASHGIIAVSIDAYDLTGWGVPDWISERGQLILKHIELWSHMNAPATFPAYPDFFAGRFANRVDMTRIGVSGHSRGGEASVAAYMLNTGFSITSVSSIAPVDFNGYVLPDVPYFVVIPAADGDVTFLSGLPIYDRAGRNLVPPDTTVKSGIYVYGANHNFFNTVWAADHDDNEDPNRADYIPATEQQTLGEAFLAAFHRIHLKDELVYQDLMRGKLTFPSSNGHKVYAFHHEKNHRKLEAGAGGGAMAGGGATVVAGTAPALHETQTLKVTWSASTATLTYTVPPGQRDVSGFEVLSFRVAQSDSSTNPAWGQDFEVELVGGGSVKATYAALFAPIPKPYDIGYPYPNVVMTTVRIPLHSFIMNNSGLPLTNVDTVRLKFTYVSQGEIYVDDLEFSR